MSALMDQVYEAEAAFHPPPASGGPASDTDVGDRRLESAVVVILSIGMAGLVFGFALTRFGWAGLLIATWPAFALAGGFGCLCQDLIRRASCRKRGR